MASRRKLSLSVMVGSPLFGRDFPSEGGCSDPEGWLLDSGTLGTVSGVSCIVDSSWKGDRPAPSEGEEMVSIRGVCKLEFRRCLDWATGPVGDEATVAEGVGSDIELGLKARSWG